MYRRPMKDKKNNQFIFGMAKFIKYEAGLMVFGNDDDYFDTSH
jgi:hypothetical protein